LPSPAPARLPRGGWTGLLEIGSEGKEKGEKTKEREKRMMEKGGKRKEREKRKREGK
jgi:hypothetical protein